jgi:hypothetical protein
VTGPYDDLSWGECPGCGDTGWVDVHDRCGDSDDLPRDYELIDGRICAPCGDCLVHYDSLAHKREADQWAQWADRAMSWILWDDEKIAS